MDSGSGEGAWGCGDGGFDAEDAVAQRNWDEFHRAWRRGKAKGRISVSSPCPECGFHKPDAECWLCDVPFRSFTFVERGGHLWAGYDGVYLCSYDGTAITGSIADLPDETRPRRRRFRFRF